MVLVRHLTGNPSAALVSAAVFTLVPYRIEHYMHLELQWTMWMPLAFWAVHRATSERSWRFGALAGLLVWLQVISSVYYGIFLALTVALLAALLVLTDPRGVGTQIGAMADVKEGLFKQGLAATFMSAADTSALIRKESARWSEVIKKAGIKPE